MLCTVDSLSAVDLTIFYLAAIYTAVRLHCCEYIGTPLGLVSVIRKHMALSVSNSIAVEISRVM